MEDAGDLADFIAELNKIIGKNGLHAVGKGVVGVVMDFDEDAIGSHGNSGAGEWKDLVALAGRVARVHDDREVAARFYRGHYGKVEGVARVVVEGADAAFAEDDIVIALGHDVFRGHQELVERGAESALQEDWFFRVAGVLEERKILHIARTDLDDVGVFLDEVEAFVVHGFGDDAEAEAVADFRKNFQSIFAESLKAIGRSAWLIGAASEKFGSGFGDMARNREGLLARFDGAGSRDDGYAISSELDRAGRRGDADDSVFGFDVAADEFIGLADRDALDDPRHGLDCAHVHGAGIAGDPDGGAVGAGDRMSLHPGGFDARADGADLLLGCVRIHYD